MRMPFDISYRAFRVWQRDRDTFLQLWKTEFWPPFVEPILFLLAFGLGLGVYVGGIGGQNYLNFIAPGILAQSVMFAAAFECTYGTYGRMVWQKTFDGILATPLSADDVVAGDMLWGATRGLISAAAILIIISVMGLVQWPSALVMLPLALLSGLMFASIAMIVTAVVPSFNEFNYFFTLGITPMFLVSGVFFPLDALPAVFQSLAWISPLTHSVRLIRAAATGEWQLDLLINLLIVVLITLVGCVVALRLMRRRLLK